MKVSKAAKERFIAKINRKGPLHPVLGTRCWEWTGSCDSEGYARFFWLGENRLAHRMAWWIHCNGSTKDLCVMHKCDNSRCVRPSHLQVGTWADNNQDKVAKGRGNNPKGDQHWARLRPQDVPRGKRNHNYRHDVTDRDRDTIYQLRKDGWLIKDIAQKYKLSEGGVSNIIKRRQAQWPGTLTGDSNAR